jgi:hypothetical protein
MRCLGVDKSNLRKADLVTSIILFVLSAAGFIMSMGFMQRTLAKGRHWFESAGLFPMIATFLLGLCAIILFTNAWNYGARFDFLKKDKIMKLLKNKEFKVALIVIGLLMVYVLVVIPLLPYWLATFLYLFSFMVIFKEKNIKSILIAFIVSAVTAAALTYGFGQLAMIPLP